MMSTTPAKISPALAKRLDDADQELEAAKARQREAIARALMPNQSKPVAKPQVKNLPPPPVPKPQLKVCKDQKCELPGGLFKPAKVTHDLCPDCSRRRKMEAEERRQADQQAQNEIAEKQREARKTEQLIADLEAGKALVCSNQCGAIERPGVGYNSELPFYCFKCREDYRARKASGQLHPPQFGQVANQRPEKVVVEDSATRARKQVKYEAQEFFVKGGETALPKGVSLHLRNGRQIILRFELAGEEKFFHTFTMPISADEKRAQDAAAQKRRIDKRAQVDMAPKGQKSQKGDNKKKGKGRN